MQGFAVHRPRATMSFRQAVEGAGQIVAFCRENGIGRLLLDTTGLSGYGHPSTEDRFLFGEVVARAGQAAVKIAVLTVPAIMDAEQFGVTVARNRGLLMAGFTSETEALAWLLDPNAA